MAKVRYVPAQLSPELLAEAEGIRSCIVVSKGIRKFLSVGSTRETRAKQCIFVDNDESLGLAGASNSVPGGLSPRHLFGGTRASTRSEAWASEEVPCMAQDVSSREDGGRRR